MKKSALILGLFVALVAGASSAHASSVTYTYTSSSPDLTTGTSFTYVSPTGFLAFDTGVLAPATASDLFIFGTDYGQLTGFDFISPSEIMLSTEYSSLTSTFGGATYQISALTPGESIGGVGTLAISNTAAVTPEPSSLLLLGTGALGLIGAVRRRVRQA